MLANYDPVEDRLTVWDSTQESHDVRGSLITMLGLDENQIRVVAPDVGGGFGAKHLMYPEEVVVAAASRILRRPVKWIEDRRENFLSTIQERDQYWDMEVAFDDDGRLLGMRGRMIHDQGAYTPRGTNLPTNASTALPGPYLLPGSRSARRRRGDQQGRDHPDPRRRLSVGEFRDRALARCDRARHSSSIVPRSGGAT